MLLVDLSDRVLPKGEKKLSLLLLFRKSKKLHNDLICFSEINK